MTDTEIAAVLRRLDAIDERFNSVFKQQNEMKQAVSDHADMDSRQHQAVSLQIAVNAADGKKDRDAIMEELGKQTEMMGVWNALGGFVKVSRWAGKVAVWVVSVGAAVAAILAFLRYGKAP